MTGSAGAEPVEVVDEQGGIIDVVTRAEVRAGNLRHRCTYVVVLDQEGMVVVHQRAPWKDVNAGYWDLCFGGICGVGEDWESSARRELAEEAGISGVELQELGPVSYDEDDGRIVGRVYLAHHAGAISCPDGEVVAVDRVHGARLDDWLAAHPVCRDSVQLVVPLLRSVLES